MLNNFDSNGAVNKMQTSKSTAHQRELFDQNNNDKYLKDRNVPSEYKFNDSSGKFKYLATNDAVANSDQENEVINSKNLENNLSLYPNKVSQSILKPLNMNINDICIKSKINSSIPASHYYSHGNSGAIKRGCEDVENENEDDLVTSISSSTSCSRRSPPKKPKFVVTSEEMNEYFNLLHQTEIQDFLVRDSCCLISDKYALAMVFTYFKRAKFNLQEYTKDNFYLALYLASDIEEDIDEYKYEIFPWALGGNWRSKFSGFLRRRDALLRRIGYRAIVSRKCCEEVMSFKSEHTAWKRERAEDHGGATRAYLISQSKRFLLSKSNLNDYDTFILPQLPEDTPRPCSICLINRGWNTTNNCINLPEQKSKPTSSITVKPDNNRYSLTKKQKSNNNHQPKEQKVVKDKIIDQTPNSKSFDSNGSETDSEYINNEETKKNSKMSAANKFIKNKLSTTELENSHRGCQSYTTNDINVYTENSSFSFVNIQYQRRSSLASDEKYLIKDSFDNSDEDDGSSSEDDVFSAEKTTSTKALLKKQEITRLNNAKLRASKITQQQNAPIRKRTNYSLTNTSNYNLRSHSVNGKNHQKITNQIVPIE